MVIVTEWQIVIDVKFYEMGPRCESDSGGPTLAQATIAPAIISPTTKGESEGDDWVFSSG